MKYYNADFDTIIWRFYLLIAVAIISFYSGLPFLAILCLPIFLSALLGITFDFNTKDEAKAKSNLMVYPASRKAA